ncbi:MAG: hypothetical protein U1E36_02040 [Rickettsiales bacterium]
MASLKAAFAALSLSIYLKWLMLLVPAIMLILWHRTSRRYFEPLLDDPREDTQRALFKLATTRSLVIIGLWFMLSMTLIVYDLRYPLNSALRENETYIPSISQPTQPVQIPAQTQTPPLQMDTDSELDLLKSRYEDAFLSYFYLKQCKLADEKDYAIIYQAFASQIQRIGLPRSMVDDTVTAALGSYETVYSGAPCKDEYLNPIKNQFHFMLQSLSPKARAD